MINYTFPVIFIYASLSITIVAFLASPVTTLHSFSLIKTLKFILWFKLSHPPPKHSLPYYIFYHSSHTFHAFSLLTSLHLPPFPISHVFSPAHTLKLSLLPRSPSYLFSSHPTLFPLLFSNICSPSSITHSPFHLPHTFPLIQASLILYFHISRCLVHLPALFYYSLRHFSPPAFPPSQKLPSILSSHTHKRIPQIYLSLHTLAFPFLPICSLSHTHIPLSFSALTHSSHVSDTFPLTPPSQLGHFLRHN